MRVVVETVGELREDYHTDIESKDELVKAVAEINESEDATMIMVGDLVVRAGNIKCMYIEGDKQ